MGIRINKVIGWGLTDVNTTKYWIDDPRFKFDKDNWEDKSEQIYNFDFKEFLLWVRDNADDLKKEVAEVNNESLDRTYITTLLLSENMMKEVNRYEKNPFTYSPEYGMDSVVLFTPPDSIGWSRRDDLIDYYESQKNSDGPEDSIQELKGGIYPYLGWHKIPGTPDIPFLKEDASVERWEFIAPAHYAMYTGTWTEGQPPVLGEDLAKFLREYYRPAIADSVLLYTKYMDIFTDWKKTVQELRPMIYTYWA